MAMEHGMIEPFEPGQVKQKQGQNIVSYGTSSYGYDIRCSDEFKLFTNLNSTIVDPKQFDSNSFVDVKSDVCIIPELVCPSSYCRVFPYPSQRADHLPREIDLCALWHHRQRHTV